MTAEIVMMPRREPELSTAAPIEPPRGEGRVQLRIVLDTIGQAERDISMLHTAVEQSLRILRRAVRTGDTTALVSTRALIEQANRRLNVRREPLLSPNINTLTRP